MYKIHGKYITHFNNSFDNQNYKLYKYWISKQTLLYNVSSTHYYHHLCTCTIRRYHRQLLNIQK